MYDTESLSSAAFGAGDAAATAAAAGQQQGPASSSSPVAPIRADVALGGRPSCMAVSEDNVRVAVAVGDEVCWEKGALQNAAGFAVVVGGGGAGAGVVFTLTLLLL